MLFFSDLDGTFLADDKSVSAASWAALDAIAAAGGQFVPCSGRAFSGLYPELLAHPAVHRECLGKPRARAMYELARGYDVTFDVFADGECYSMRRHWERLGEYVADPHILESMRTTRTPVDVEIPELIEQVDALERVAMYWKDPADRDALWPAAEALPQVSVVRSYPMNIEVSDARGTKGGGLLWLASYLGVDAAETVGFGDQRNDVSMIRAAGTGCAMANAEPEALAAADVVVASNNEDGVARYIMERLGV